MSFDFDSILANKKKTNVEKIAVKCSETEPVASKSFDYDSLPDDVANSLHRHEATIRGIQSKAIFEIGEELQAAHDELANYRNGCFQEWCRSIGFDHPMKVKRILDYHTFIVTNCDDKEFLESLPKSLIYEVANESAPKKLKEGVLNGDITTLKEYKKLKEELEAEKKAKSEAEQRADEAKQQAEHLRSALLDAQNKPPTVVETRGVPQEKYDRLKQELEEMRHNPPVERVEVKPDDYESIKRENAMLRAHEEGESLHQKALIDAQYSAYQMSAEEEYQASTQMDNLLSALLNIPKGIEIRENVRCWIKEQEDDDYAVSELEKALIDLQDIRDALQEALKSRRKLRLVKNEKS